MNLFSDAFIQALCWTLVHSLWQGLALALVAGTIIMLTKKAGTFFRYNLLTALLSLFLVCVAITFYVEFNHHSTAVANQNEVSHVSGPGNTQQILMGDVQTKGTGYKALVISFLNNNASLIVFAWILIIAFKCSRLITDLRYIYVLRRRLIYDAGENWDNRLKQLAHKLAISKPVRLLQSGLVKMPVVLGHIKPVILLPVGVLTSLPPDEIEAVLLHELAHIRRKDFLINMLQNICEIIFFFNPAVQWLSGIIKEERENCCDDIAINEVKNKKQLINALITFQEFEGAAAEYAVGFAGKKMHLLNRIKRIITNNNQTLNNMERTLLATGIVITSIATIAFRQTQTEIAAPQQKSIMAAATNKIIVADNTEHAIKSDAVMFRAIKDEKPQNARQATRIRSAETKQTDTVPAEENYRGHHSGSISTTKDGKQYEIYLRNDEIIALYIDDKRIPDGKISDYKQTVDQIIKEGEAAREESRAARREAQEARREADANRREAERSREHAERERNEARERREVDEVRERTERNENEVRERREAGEIRERAERSREEANMERRNAEMAHREADRARERSEMARERGEESRRRGEQARRESERMIQELISDLKEDGLIKDDKELSFSISSDELIVNGKKQPSSVHVKFKEKYIREPNTKISYSHSNNRTSVSTTTSDSNHEEQ